MPIQSNKAPAPAPAGSNGKKPSRFETEQKRIGELVRLTKEDVAATFPHNPDDNMGPSVTFWQKLKELVALAHDTHSWDKIVQAVNAARARRCKNPGSSATRSWQPADVRFAEDALMKGVIRGSPDQILSLDLDEPADGQPGVHIIFCVIGTPPNSIFAECGERSLKVNPKDPFKSPMWNAITEEFLQQLERDVGNGLCYNASSWVPGPGEQPLEGPDLTAVNIHIVIVALLWAKYTGRVAVEFHDWEWLEDITKSETFEAYLAAIGKPVILFTHMARPHWSQPSWEGECDLKAVHDAVSEAGITSSHPFTCYPSREELLGDANRLLDCKNLDEIAKKAPEEMSWRPKVCYGSSGTCPLKDYDGNFLVRASSRKGPGTTMIVNSRHPKLPNYLKCQASGRRGGGGKALPAADPQSHYFHQELPLTLKDWGEIVVLMVGDQVYDAYLFKGDFGGDDTWRGSLTARCCFTSWKKPDGTIETVDKAVALAKVDELHEFCKYYRKQLLEHREMAKKYETLEIAAVFHIGISHIGPDAKFFILEMPRWPGACLFGPWLRGTGFYDELAEAIGKRFAAKYGAFQLSEQPNDDEQEEEEEEEEGEEDEDG